MSKLKDVFKKLTDIDNSKKKPLKESVVHMKNENTFNDLIPAKQLKVGDMVYDDENGHKLEVLEITDGKYYGSKNIKFKDLETGEIANRYPGGNWLYEKVFENNPIKHCCIIRCNFSSSQEKRRLIWSNHSGLFIKPLC